MKNNGFTLVELLGVVVILGIVFSLAVVAYKSTKDEINKSYYSTLEESLLIPGGDYFTYNKGAGPSIFGDTAKVKIKDLKNEGYLDTEVLDSEGNSCDLENSYVGAYKDSIDKTNYYVCLVCGSYKTENTACDDDRRRVDYSLGVRANKKESSDVYNISGNSWSNEDITLTFETLNEMDTVILTSDTGGNVSSCNLTSRNNIKSCTITVTKSGNYQAYAKNNSNSATTRKQDIKILIDKEKPTFDIKEKGELKDIVVKEEEKDLTKEPEKIKTIEVEIEGEIEDLEKEIENQVYNIKDNGGSGIKSIEYTLEFDEDKDYYKEQGKVTSFNIKKSLKLGIHHFKVRVTDNAGNKTEDKIDYIVYKLIVLPTPELYCNDLTYNDKEQILLKSELGEGYEIKDQEEERTNEEIKETDANKYDLKVMPLENYRFAGDDIEPKTLTCEIKKKEVTITANSQTITYGNSIQTGTSKVSTSGILSGHTLSYIKLNQVEIRDGNSRIDPSDATIKKGTNNVTSNYEISYVSGNLNVNPKISFSIASSGGKYESGYKTDVHISVTCSSLDSIDTFKGNTDSTSDSVVSFWKIYASNGNYSYTNELVLTVGGKNREVTASCTTMKNNSSSNDTTYNVYEYSVNDSCSCSVYKRCSSAGCDDYNEWIAGSSKTYCSEADTNEGYCKEHFGVESSKFSIPDIEYTKDYSKCECTALGGSMSGVSAYAYTTCTTYSRTCRIWKESSICGCKTHSLCWHL